MIIKALQSWLLTRCWCEWEVIDVFEKKMQNKYEREIICESLKCKKCDRTTVKKFWKDLYTYSLT